MESASPPDESVGIFRHREHPGDLPASMIYTTRAVTPFFVTMLPWMLVATAAALMTRDPIPYLLWGIPVSYLLATSWTMFIIRRDIAEIYLFSGQLAIRTVWDVARRNRRLTWEPLVHVRRTRSGVVASAGRSVYEFHEEEWEDFEELKRNLRRTLHEVT